MSTITDANIVTYFKAITDPNAKIDDLQEIYKTVKTPQETCEHKMKNYKDCILKKLQEIANDKGKNVYLYLTPETINSIYTTDQKITLPNIVELDKKTPKYTFQPSDFDNALAIFKHKGNISDMQKSIKQINQDFIIKFVNYKPPGNTTAYYFRIAAYVLYLYSSQPDVPIATEIVMEVTANDTGINEEEKAIIFEKKKKLKLDARQHMAIERFSKYRTPGDPVCFLLHGVGTGKTITSLHIALHHLNNDHMDKKVPEGIAAETNPLHILIIAPQGLFSTSFKDDARSCGIYIYNSRTDVNGIESCSCLYQKGENEYFINLMGCDYNNLFENTKMIDILTTTPINVLICDEAHRLLTNQLQVDDPLHVKNKCALEDTRFIQFVKNISQSIFLTGTPIQKDSDDLVKIAIFLNTLNKSNHELLKKDEDKYSEIYAIFKPLSRIALMEPGYNASKFVGVTATAAAQLLMSGGNPARKGGKDDFELANIYTSTLTKNVADNINIISDAISDAIIRSVGTESKMKDLDTLLEKHKEEIKKFAKSIDELYDKISKISDITISSTSVYDFKVSFFLFLFLFIDFKVKKQVQSVQLGNVSVISSEPLYSGGVEPITAILATIGSLAYQSTIRTTIRTTIINLAGTIGGSAGSACRKYLEYESIVDIDKLVEYSRNFVSVYNYDYNYAAIETDKYHEEIVEDTWKDNDQVEDEVENTSKEEGDNIWKDVGEDTLGSRVVNAEGNTNQFPRKHVIYTPVQFTDPQIKAINSLKDNDKYEKFKATNNFGCIAMKEKDAKAYQSQSNLNPREIMLKKESDRKNYGYTPEEPFKQEESTDKPEYKSVNIRNSYYVKDAKIPPELIKNISQNIPIFTPEAIYLRFQYIFDELLFIRTGKIRYNDKIVYHPHYILNGTQVEYYLPVVYPPTLEIMYTFCKFLDEGGVKYLWMNQENESSIVDHFDCAAKYTFPIQPYEQSNENPICIIISPSHTEGFSFVYNPAIFVPALCITAGDQEQVYGRILRKYRNPYTIEGDKKEYKFDKFVYQYFGANKEDIQNINNFNILYGMGQEKGNLIYFKDFELIHIFKKHCKPSEKDADFERYKHIFISSVVQGEKSVQEFVRDGQVMRIDGHDDELIKDLNDYYAKLIKEAKYKNISSFRNENFKQYQWFRSVDPLQKKFNKTVEGISVEGISSTINEIGTTIKGIPTTPLKNYFKTEQQRKDWLDQQKNPVMHEIEHLSDIDATNTSSERYFNELVNCENMTYVNNVVIPEDISIRSNPGYVKCDQLLKKEKKEKHQGGKRTRRRKSALTRRKKSTRAPRRKITRAKKHKNRHTKKYA